MSFVFLFDHNATAIYTKYLGITTVLLTLQKQIIKKNLVLIRLACKLTGGTKVQQQRRDFLQSAIVQLNLKKSKSERTAPSNSDDWQCDSFKRKDVKIRRKNYRLKNNKNG